MHETIVNTRADPGFFKGGGPKKVDLGFLCAV